MSKVYPGNEGSSDGRVNLWGLLDVTIHPIERSTGQYVAEDTASKATQALLRYLSAIAEKG